MILVAFLFSSAGFGGGAAFASSYKTKDIPKSVPKKVIKHKMLNKTNYKTPKAKQNNPVGNNAVGNTIEKEIIEEDYDSFEDDDLNDVSGC